LFTPAASAQGGAVRSAAVDIMLSYDEDGVGYALRKYFPTEGHELWSIPSAE
jgi:hypothetical protein